jgi:Na+/H+ antiporter NhaC
VELKTKVRFTNTTLQPNPIPYYVTLNGEVVETGTFPRATDTGELTEEFDCTVPGSFINGASNWREIIVHVGTPGSTTASQATHGINLMPGGLTILPIIIMLVVALLTHQVLFALYVGVFMGAWFINGYNPLTGFERSLDEYMPNAIADQDHAKILLFSWFLSAMIALIQRNGGASGLALEISKFAKTRSSAMWMTYVLGILIFIDDYASCLIVGAQMQPITDLNWVSREKLAFLVHSTSAPPASIIPLSAWIGFELGLLAEELRKVGDPADAFSTFLETILSRYYPWYILIFVAFIIALKMDFGPMLAAERRALRLHQLTAPTDTAGENKEKVEVVPGKPQRWWNAVIPLVTCIIIIILTIFLTGYYNLLLTPEVVMNAATLAGAGDSYAALIYGSFVGAVLAVILSWSQGIMTFHDCMHCFLQGVRNMTEPMLILILAWSISAVVTDLGTARWLASALTGNLDWRALPVLVFILAMVMSFCTGSSWGTMGIMFPLAIPLAWELPEAQGEPYDVLHASVVHVSSAILAGSIFGDQCSPISDTSILSAMSSGVSVEAHITTQMPYAVFCAFLAILLGYLPLGYFVWPGWAGLLIGAAVLGPSVWLLGTKVDSDAPSKFMFMEGWAMPWTKKAREEASALAAESAALEESAFEGVRTNILRLTLQSCQLNT